MAKTKAETQREYEKRTNYAAQRKFEKENVRRYVLKVMVRTESDILEKLESIENKSGYIKELIRRDINT